MIFVGAIADHQEAQAAAHGMALRHYGHMVTNDGDDELHAFAVGLGLTRRDAWRDPIWAMVNSRSDSDPVASATYYALTALRRELAVKRGAVALTGSSARELFRELQRRRRERRHHGWEPGQFYNGHCRVINHGRRGVEILTSHSEIVTVEEADLHRACRVCGRVDDGVRARSYRTDSFLGSCGSGTCELACESVRCRGRVGVLACDACESGRR